MWSACTPNLLTLLQSPCAVQCLGEGDQMNFSSSMFSKKQSSCMQMFPCANTCTHAQVHACTCTYIHVCYYTSKPSSSPQQEFNTKSKKEQKKNYYINQNSSGPFSVAHFLYVTEDLGLHPFFTDFFFQDSISHGMSCPCHMQDCWMGWVSWCSSAKPALQTLHNTAHRQRKCTTVSSAFLMHSILKQVKSFHLSSKSLDPSSAKMPPPTPELLPARPETNDKKMYWMISAFSMINFTFH